MNRKNTIPFIIIISLILGVVIIYILYFLIKYDLYILIDAWSNRDRFLSTVKNLVTSSAYILFLLLILIFWVKRLLLTLKFSTAPQPETRSVSRPRLLILSWFGGLVVVLGFIAGISVYVDPRSMYGTTFYLPEGVPDRILKVNDYEALPQTPDVLIFGSSRAFGFSPAYITQKLGYTAFNMALTSGKINDFWLYTNFILTQHDKRLPKVILMEIEYPFIVARNYTAAYSPFNLMPFFDDDTRRQVIQSRLDGLWDLDQFAQSFWVMRYSTFFGQPQFYTVHSDGWTTPASKATPAQLDSNLTAAINSLWPGCFMQAIPEGETMLRDYLAMARTYGSTVILLRTPYQASYYEAMKERIPNFDECDRNEISFYTSLTKEYDNVIFEDYQNPERFEGIQTVDGYYDQVHMTIENATRLLDLLLAPIQNGYQLAIRNSTEHL